MAYNQAYGAGWEVQRRYDNAYQQCMYAKGNQIPAVTQARPPEPLCPAATASKELPDRAVHVGAAPPPSPVLIIRRSRPGGIKAGSGT
jgi:hypothetical protein